MNSQKKKEKVMSTNRSDHPINHSQEGEFEDLGKTTVSEANACNIGFKVNL